MRSMLYTIKFNSEKKYAIKIKFFELYKQTTYQLKYKNRYSRMSKVKYILHPTDPKTLTHICSTLT